jgi:ABC-2 type transport system permease protein
MQGRTKRILSLMLQELFLTRHSLEIVIDTLVFPLMNIVLFGLITRFLSHGNHLGASYLILGVLLWEVVGVNQYNVTVSSLWSVWSHNLTNIFIAPISTAEYMTAQILAAFLRAAGIFLVLGVGSYFIFSFNLLHLGVLNLLLFVLNLSIFAWWVGIVLLGLIFRFGLRVQAIAWGTIFVVQPLTASFYPVSILPHWLQAVAHALPATYVFEAGRQALSHSGINARYALMAFGLNLGYLALSLLLFRYLFNRSRATGQFARNDL